VRGDSATSIEPSAIIDGPPAWARLGVAVLLCTIGSVGLWSVVVVLPALQAEFAVARAEASLPYTLTTLGFGLGGIVIGRAVDRFGTVPPLAVATLMLGLGYIGSAYAGSLWQFAAVQGVLIGVGSAATFGPMIADISTWFVRRRGIAVAVCSAGNYLAGAIWPPVIDHFIRTAGWRQTQFGVGVFCIAAMLPLLLLLRRRAPVHEEAAKTAPAAVSARPLGLSPAVLMTLLCVAGVACCTAMAMPQVHIVPYCGDLGYGVARGAQMLALMLGFGIVSRVGSGFVADRIGGLATLLLGSLLQGLALVLYLCFQGLGSLYVISALFGLFQGGIVPSYPIIVREHFPAGEAGGRIGVVLFATLVGMALGGWMSGKIFDLTGSYQAAFANGVLWNVLNGAIVLFLLLRANGRRQLASAGQATAA
jgi:MFS family permease